MCLQVSKKTHWIYVCISKGPQGPRIWGLLHLASFMLPYHKKQILEVFSGLNDSVIPSAVVQIPASMGCPAPAPLNIMVPRESSCLRGLHQPSSSSWHDGRLHPMAFSCAWLGMEVPASVLAEPGEAGRELRAHPRGGEQPFESSWQGARADATNVCVAYCHTGDTTAFVPLSTKPWCSAAVASIWTMPPFLSR